MNITASPFVEAIASQIFICPLIPEGMTKEEFCAETQSRVLAYQAHNAPLDAEVFHASWKDKQNLEGSQLPFNPDAGRGRFAYSGIAP